MKTRNLYILLFQFIVLGLQAQTVVRGVVSDKGNKEPIPFANVYEVNSSERIIGGTVTDFNGFYQLELSDVNSVLRFSYIGYHSLDMKYSGTSTVDAHLESSSKELEGVTISAEAKRDETTFINERDFATSRVKLDMSSMSDLGISSAEEALQGQIAGLDILSGGSPGSSGSIVIRGLGTLGDASPLIVVDGVPQDVSVDDDFDFASAEGEDIGDLVSIATQDIKSIEVLKDAGSTAIYGSKGANGVLLIETFDGVVGETKFSFNYKFSMSNEPTAVPLLNGDEYITMQMEQLHNAYGYNYTLPSDLMYDPSDPNFYNISANTDWQDAIRQTGQTNDAYVSLSGGGSKTKYFASVNYKKESGTTVNTGLEQINTRVNLDYILSDKLTFRAKFSYANSVKEDNYSFNSGIIDNVRNIASRRAPNMSIYEYDSEGNPIGSYYAPEYSYQSGTSPITDNNYRWFYNPAAITDLSRNDIEANNVQATLVTDLKLTNTITFREQITYQFLGEKQNKFLPEQAIGVPETSTFNNRSSEKNSLTSRLMTQTQMFWIPKLNSAHSLITMVRFDTDQKTNKYFTYSNSLYPNGIDDPSAPGVGYLGDVSDADNEENDLTNRSQLNEVRMLSALTNINYVLYDRYILSVAYRVDGDSKVGKTNRWGDFPGISTAWRLTSENWFNVKQFNDIKFRYSWGKTGKSPSKAYDHTALYNSNGTYRGNPVVIPSEIQLNNLRWENQVSHNVGLDVTAFDNRLDIVFDYYYKLTKDLLQTTYKIPTSTGFTQLKPYNGGSLENKGWELSVNYLAMKTKNSALRFNFNIAGNKNAYTEIPANLSNDFEDNELGTSFYPYVLEEGKPMGSYYGLDYQGVYAYDSDVQALGRDGQPLVDSKGNAIPLQFENSYTFKGGDAKYRDINYDGKIDMNDAIYLGNVNPDLIGGFGANYRWKNFSVSAQFVYRLGYQIVNIYALNTQGMNNKNNQSTATLRRWRKPGDGAGMAEGEVLPRAYVNHPANNLQSDRYVEDGDYLRLNNVSLKYSLGKKVCQLIGVDKIEVSANMRKLYTWTNYSGQDPEIKLNFSSSQLNKLGTDQGEAPPSRMFTYGLKVNF